MKLEFCGIALSLVFDKINAGPTTLRKRDNREADEPLICTSIDGPVVTISILDIYFGSSEDTLMKRTNQAFDNMDLNKNGVLENVEITRKMHAAIVTNEPDTNITEQNVLKLDKAPGDHTISREQFLKRAKEFSSKSFESCDGFCKSVSAKLDTCKSSMSDLLVKRGNFMMNLCRMGQNKFTEFGKCVQTKECQYIQDCFNGVKKNTHCPSGKTKCRGHSGFYVSHENLATTTKPLKHQNGTTSLTTSEKDVTASQHFKKHLILFASTVTPIVIMITILTAPSVAAYFASWGLTEMQVNLANYSLLAIKLSMLSSMLLFGITWGDNFFGVSGPQ